MIKHIYNRYKTLLKSFLWKFHHFNIIKSAQRGCQCSRSLAFPCNQKTTQSRDAVFFYFLTHRFYANNLDLGPH